MRYLLYAIALLMPFVLFGQDAPALPAEVLDPQAQMIFNLLGPILGSLVEQYPTVGKILMIVINARVFVKPLMSAFKAIGEGVPAGKLRSFMLSVSGHWAYKIVAYFFDWVLSVKLPQKAKGVA